MEISLYWEEGGERVKGVVNFNYLGQTLYQTDNKDATKTGRSVPQGSGNVIQGGDIRGNNIWG